VVCAAVVVACRQYLPANRYLQPRRSSQATLSTADARYRFSHPRHEKALAAASVTCVECHRFDALIDADDEQVARTLSTRALHPGSASCHFCHRAEMARMAQAPDACTTCHTNIAPLLPEDHQIAWLKVHASSARANPAQCETCHRQSFCIDCHQRRDTIHTVVHERNFRFFHSVEARANPIQCGSCHRADFCINCHQAGKVVLP